MIDPQEIAWAHAKAEAFRLANETDQQSLRRAFALLERIRFYELYAPMFVSCGVLLAILLGVLALAGDTEAKTLHGASTEAKLVAACVYAVVGMTVLAALFGGAKLLKRPFLDPLRDRAIGDLARLSETDAGAALSDVFRKVFGIDFPAFVAEVMATLGYRTQRRNNVTDGS